MDVFFFFFLFIKCWTTMYYHFHNYFFFSTLSESKIIISCGSSYNIRSIFVERHRLSMWEREEGGRNRDR